LKLKQINRYFVGAGLLATLAVGWQLFGMIGLRTFGAILLFFFLPFYLIF